MTEDGATECRAALAPRGRGPRSRRRGLRRRRGERLGPQEGLGSSVEEIQEKAKEEGQVNLINWAGYVEKDWVTPFEQQTGCTVNSKVGAQLRRDGDVDAHGELRRRLGLG